MIELRLARLADIDRLPVDEIVALLAVRAQAALMLIFVAVLALRRRRLEVDIHQPGFKVRRLVAIDAGRRPMRAQQSKLRLGMIEAR